MSDAPRVYKFGVTPWQHGQSEDDIRSRFKPMLEWLGNEINARFIIVSARDYNQMIELLAHGHIDIGSISPLPFVLAQNANPEVEMLVTETSWDVTRTVKSPIYNSIIITLKDRCDITTLESLRNKSFGYVSNQSTSGYLYPLAYFKKHGVEPATYFSRVYFLGSHPRLSDAVAAGSIDAGATWDYNLKEAIAKHGQIFKIVEIVGDIPNLGIASSSTLDFQTKELIKSALLRIDVSLLDGLPAAGYVAKDASYYDSVRDVLDLMTDAETPLDNIAN